MEEETELATERSEKANLDLERRNEHGWLFQRSVGTANLAPAAHRARVRGVDHAPLKKATAILGRWLAGWLLIAGRLAACRTGWLAGRLKQIF